MGALSFNSDNTVMTPLYLESSKKRGTTTCRITNQACIKPGPPRAASPGQPKSHKQRNLAFLLLQLDSFKRIFREEKRGFCTRVKNSCTPATSGVDFQCCRYETYLNINLQMRNLLNLQNYRQNNIWTILWGLKDSVNIGLVFIKSTVPARGTTPFPRFISTAAELETNKT